MQSLRWWWLLGGMVGGMLASGCESGQTGSASCADTRSCVCRTLVDRVLAEATVLAVNGREITLHIDAVLNPGGSRYEPPSTLIARYATDYFVCRPTTVEEPRVGAHVRALIGWDFGSQPCPLENLSDASNDGAAGSTDVDPACRPGQVQTGLEVALLPTSDTIDLGGGNVLPPSDVAALTDRQACDDRYPDHPVPCDDMPDSCAMRATSQAVSGGSWSIAALLLSAVAFRMRRSARKAR